jgi:hypothetical protein
MVLFKKINELFGMSDKVIDIFLNFGDVEIEHGLNGFDVHIDHLNEI